jgi:hypothetical protein
MRNDLITPDGRYDKAAILRDAHCHRYGAMRRHGWGWSRCLAFSWAQARAMQERPQLAASGEEEGAACAGGSHANNEGVGLELRAGARLCVGGLGRPDRLSRLRQQRLRRHA